MMNNQDARMQNEEQVEITKFFKASKGTKNNVKVHHARKDKKKISRYKQGYGNHKFKLNVKLTPRLYNDRSYAGVNRLLNTKLNTFFYMLDIHSWQIHSNDKKFVNVMEKEEQYTYSTVERPNDKFKLTTLLTTFFYHQRFIPNRVRNRYFLRLRDLLMTQLRAIENRVTKPNNERHNNRRTKTYIRFSYKKRSCYLGIWIPCKGVGCPLPCAYVMNDQRTKCSDHVKDYYREDIERREKVLGKRVERKIVPVRREKRLYSERLGIEYIKYRVGHRAIQSDQDRYVKYGEYRKLDQHREKTKSRQSRRLFRFFLRTRPKDSEKRASFYETREDTEKQQQFLNRKLGFWSKDISSKYDRAEKEKQKKKQLEGQKKHEAHVKAQQEAARERRKQPKKTKAMIKQEKLERELQEEERRVKEAKEKEELIKAARDRKIEKRKRFIALIEEYTGKVVSEEQVKQYMNAASAVDFMDLEKLEQDYKKDKKNSLMGIMEKKWFGNGGARQ